jgi:putative membrane protein
MIRKFRYLILGLVALVLISLATANRAPVALRAFPDDLAVLFGMNYEIQVPLFLVVFAGEWAREHKHRAAAASGTRQVKRLERELAVMKDSSSSADDDVLALLAPKKS